MILACAASAAEARNMPSISTNKGWHSEQHRAVPDSSVMFITTPLPAAMRASQSGHVSDDASRFATGRMAVGGGRTETTLFFVGNFCDEETRLALFVDVGHLA